jgi:hypothetical protein
LDTCINILIYYFYFKKICAGYLYWERVGVLFYNNNNNNNNTMTPRLKGEEEGG